MAADEYFLGVRCFYCSEKMTGGLFCEHATRGSHWGYGESCTEISPFSFKSIDLFDSNLAVFKCEKIARPKPLQFNHLLRRTLRRQLPDQPAEDKQPVAFVQVRGGLNDFEVPISRLDMEDQESSVEWKVLFTKYSDQVLKGVEQQKRVSFSLQRCYEGSST